MQDIQEFIKYLTEREETTLQGISDRLGYKSRTTMDRIVRGSANPESIRKIEKVLLDHMRLSEEEIKALHEAVQVSIYGAEKVRAMQQMWVFVQGQLPSQSEKMHIVDARTQNEVDLTVRYADAQNVHITVVNAPYVPGLFSILQKLLEKNAVTVDHFLTVNASDARTVSSVCMLMPIFYQRGYNGYVRNDSNKAYTGLNDADMVIVEYRMADGCAKMDIIHLPDKETGLLIEMPGAIEHFSQQLGLTQECYTSFKRSYFSCTSFEDYIQYSTEYAQLEKNRAIWKIKPDIGVDQIPTDIMKQAMLEGNVPKDEQFVAVLSLLCDIYRKRYQDSYSKRKPSYTIFKRGAFTKFATTGKTSDHFCAMRPYTPQERIAILRDMLNQQKSNPYVHFYFLKDDTVLRDVEIACYDQTGILILPSDTDYNLPEGHSEIMVSHPQMMNLFQEFFTEILVRDYVCTDTETVQFLNDLISNISRRFDEEMD